MVHILKKIKCKYTGSEEYQPEGISRDKWLKVIGYETRKREKDFEGKKQQVEDIYYLVINDKGRLITIAAFNCSTMIDEQSEINGGELITMLNTISLMGKIISEKMAKYPDKKGDGSGTDEG